MRGCEQTKGLEAVCTGRAEATASGCGSICPGLGLFSPGSLCLHLMSHHLVEAHEGSSSDQLVDIASMPPPQEAHGEVNLRLLQPQVFKAERGARRERRVFGGLGIFRHGSLLTAPEWRSEVSVGLRLGQALRARKSPALWRRASGVSEEDNEMSTSPTPRLAGPFLHPSSAIENPAHRSGGRGSREQADAQRSLSLAVKQGG